MNEAGELELCYPHARVFVQRENFKNALEPNPREKASYLEENVDILRAANLELLEGDTEIYPDIWVRRTDGHTRGQQYVEIRNGNEAVYYVADLIPTSHHLPVPYNMGYDIHTEKLLEEKEAFLAKVLENNSIIVFEHDPEVAAIRITTNDKGHYAVKETIEI